MYECKYCGLKYETQKEALECYDGHRIILVPIALSDLNGLIHFLYFKDDRYLNPSMVKVLKRYLRNNAKKS